MSPSPSHDRARPTIVADRPKVLLNGALIVVLTILAYLPVIIDGGFIWDDDDYITTNAALRDVPGLIDIWTPGRTRQYYPLVYTTFWIEYQIHELDPRGYHLINVLLHAANALLVWLLARRIGIPGAWLIGAVFALHPVHVESVAWITERKNVLSGLFYLSAALTYLRFERQYADAPVARLRRSTWGWYAAALALFAAALLSKSVTCSLPAALILIALYQRRPITIGTLARLVPMFVVGLGMGLITMFTEQSNVFGEGAGLGLSPAERLLVASRALLFYPVKLLCPWPLIFIYPRWVIDAGSLAAWWPIPVVVAIAAIAIIASARGWRAPALAVAFYAVTIFPALGFIDIYPMHYSFVADHFQYLASLGIIACVIGGIRWMFPNRWTQTVAGVLILPVLFVLTWRQGAIYHDEATLWTDVAERNEVAWIAHNNLAGIRLCEAADAMNAGDRTKQAALAEEARGRAATAIALKPDLHTAQANLAESLRLLGRLDEALIPAREAVALAPQVSSHHFALGRLYQLAGRGDEAAAEYREALRLQPNAAIPRMELAKLLATQGRLDEAAEEFSRAIDAGSESVTALAFLGDTAVRRRQFAAAAQYYRRAIASAEREQDRLNVAYNLAVLLATCPDPAVRSGAEAISIASQLRQATGGTLPQPLDVLGMAYAEVGRFDDAIRAAEQAASVARALHEPSMDALASQIEQRIEAYRAGRAWRQ